jgi:pyridoxamine 5'-phosphate oxidase
MELDLGPDPVAVFEAWYLEAVAANDPFPDAMTLATAGADRQPSARVVLYKGMLSGRVSFYTNYESRKGRELAENPRAALLFHWTSLRRQVRIEGSVTRLEAPVSDAYFQTRPRESQLGAWASPQSSPVATRVELETRFAELEARYAEGHVPRPPFWGGYALEPHWFEFWIGKDYRLHDRFAYLREAGTWRRERLAP